MVREGQPLITKNAIFPDGQSINGPGLLFCLVQPNFAWPAIG